MIKQKVTIIYGGPSSEHEVSINSAKNVMDNIDFNFFDLEDIFIQKDSVCLYKDVKYQTLKDVLDILDINTIIFPIIHGSFGEDGKLQKLLEENNFKYIGSDSVSSSLAIDKFATQNLLTEHKIDIPKTFFIQNIEQIGFVDLPFPLIVKPVTEGSSVDLYKVESRESLVTAVQNILSKNENVLVQECVVGREFTCGVFENGKELIALTPTEVILTKTKMFDYEAKYTPGGCNEVTPAEVDINTENRIRELAKAVHSLVRCRDISRTDMIMRNSGELCVLEINTMPGMTKTSFIPAEAVAAGYDMKNFFSIIIKNHI